MSATLIERCKGRWTDVLVAVGIPEAALSGKQTACPACGGKDRFRFDDKGGSGSWFCNQCPRRSGYGIHLPQQVFGWNYAETCNAIEAVLVGAEPNAHRGRHIPASEMSTVVDTLPGSGVHQKCDDLERARRLWNDRRPVTLDNSAGRYLERRGLDVGKQVNCIGFHPQVLYLDPDGEFVGRFPSMLAAVQTPDGKPSGVHRTFLTSDGRKADVPAPRKLMGSLPDGAAVRLAAHADELGIAEGIETALSATALTGVPCWAAINANGLAKWSPPDGVRSVVIFGDNDASLTGQAAAYALGKRLLSRRIAVRVEIPPTVGDDWNDVLKRRIA